MSKNFRALLLVSTAFVFSALTVPAHAGESEDKLIKALQKQIAAQQQQLDAQQRQLNLLMSNMAPPSPSVVTAQNAPSPTTAPKAEGSAQVASQPLAKPDIPQSTPPSVDIDPAQGLTISSPDKQYALRLAAYAQFDAHQFIDDTKSTIGTNTNTFIVRRARPVFDAKMTKYFNAYFMPDFGTGQARLFDAYGEFHPMPDTKYLNLRIGQFKAPLGLERTESGQELSLIERSLANDLVPQRDEGAMLYGQAIPGILDYQLGVFNGAADLSINNGQTGDNKDIDGRLSAHPFAASDHEALKGLGLGFAGSWGRHQGSTSSSGLTSGLVADSQRVVFSYLTTSGVFANGSNWRINPQLTYYYGPFGLMGDFVEEGQDIKRATSVMLHNKAWESTASYVLTGENASYDGVRPAHNFDPASNHWGAFELAGRYSELAIDKKAFPTYADPTASINAADEATVGLNWYFNPSVKFNTDYSHTSFSRGSSTGNRPDEQLFMTRVQVRY